MPEAIEALVAANSGYAAGYGADHVGKRAADLIRALLDADAEVRFVPSGTAANALTIAALAQPHEAVICHQDAHIATDEAGAPGFFGAVRQDALALMTQRKIDRDRDFLPGGGLRLDLAADGIDRGMRT